MTRNQIANQLKEIGSSHRQVRTCEVVEPDYFLDNEVKDVVYPAVWFTLGRTELVGKEKTTYVLMTVADIIQHPNRLNQEVENDLELIVDDLISQIDWDKNGWKLERNFTYSLGRDVFADECITIDVELGLNQVFTYDACNLPSTYELPNGNFVYINTNRFMTVADFIVGTGSAMEDGDTSYQNNLLTVPPFVFIGGQLLTYQVRTDRRYVTHNANTKTITVNNGGVIDGEHVFIII